MDIASTDSAHGITQRRLYGVREAANILGLGQSTIWAMLQRGDITPVRLGGRTLIAVSEIDRLIEANTATKSAA